MPEGPEIRIAADKVAKAIVNKPIQEIFFAFERLKPYQTLLAQQLVTKVDTKGKAMLIRFDNGLSIFSHNQLYGKWFTKRAYNYPSTNRQLRLGIHCQSKSALLYSASDIDVLTPEQLVIHPFLSRLGPDILNADTTVAQITDRLQQKAFCRRRLTTLLLDQSFLAGLGNYLRSEILFVARVHPLMRPVDCTDEQIEALAEAAIAISRQSYRTKGITNDLKIVTELEADGYHRREYRHWVFGRSGAPCHICHSSITKEFSGGRRYYYCPRCQAIN